ncbi:hypothetical protein GW17_00059767 [Ensete ventricosum]|nr:hypothetical protein GW17_00059767 [Ensete ventricosum]
MKVGATCGGGAATCKLFVCRDGWPWPGPLQGRPAMALVPVRGGRLGPGPLQGATTRGHGRLVPARRGNRLWPTRKGQPAAANPQGPAGSGQPARDYRPLPALSPAGAATPVAGVATPWQGGAAADRKGQLPPA